MNLFTGTAMLIFTGILFLKYKPKAKNSRGFCGMAGAMGFMALTAGAGNWVFQLVQTVLMGVVGLCCFVELHREKVLRERRAVYRRVPNHEKVVANKVKTCA